VLRSFGWRVVDIPGRDWIADPGAVLRRIEDALAGADALAESADLDDDDAEVENGHRAARSEVPVVSESLPASPSRRFTFVQGGSSKFWQISLAGTELTENYGRIGTSGQSNLKNFDTAERARREMDKLVDEKLRKGYVEEPGSSAHEQTR